MEQKTPQKPEMLRGKSETSTPVSASAATLGQSFGAYAPPESSTPKQEQEAPSKGIDIDGDGKPDLVAELGKAKATSNPWEKEKRPLASTVDGRFAIRCFSRGIMGAAFFAAGGIIAERALKGYDYAAPLSKQKNPLQMLSKTIDTVVGKPIEKMFGKSAVTFRDTRAFEMLDKAGNVLGYRQGRSLGHESVMITFDFAMASVGDAWGRNIAGIVDPNVKKKWLDEKGHVDFPQLVKDTLKSTWKILSYNQAEDWAVAIPYAYQMKFQRKALDRMFPGFRYDFDRTANGGSVRIDNQNRITGDYALPGAIDLQLRFTGYNVGTLIYREAYNKVAEKLEDWKESGYKMPEMHISSPKDIVHKVDETLSDLGKYLVKSVIKGTIFMTPSVPFFWLFRTPQSKWKGAAINPDYESEGYKAGTHQKGGALAHAQDDGVSIRARMRAGDEVHIMPSGIINSETGKRTHEVVGVYSPPKEIRSYNAGESSNVVLEKSQRGSPFLNYARDRQYHSNERTHSVASEVLNPAGKLSMLAGDKSIGIMGDANKLLGRLTGKSFESGTIKQFAREHMNAAFAYTPYMYAKAEFANAWDNKHMDHALYETLDGVFGGNAEKFKSGIKETFLALTKQLPAKKEWREMVAQDLKDNQKIDIQSMSQSERVKRNGGGKPAAEWKEKEQKRVQQRDSEPPQGVTIH